MYRIYKECLQLGSKNHPFPKQVKDVSRHFPKENMQIDKKHTQRCSTSLNIREMQNTIIMISHLTPIRLIIQIISKGE